MPTGGVAILVGCSAVAFGSLLPDRQHDLDLTGQGFMIVSKQV